MSSFYNFVWDCYIKSFENADALIESSKNLSIEEKNSLMNLSDESLKIWEKLFNDRKDFLFKNVKLTHLNKHYSLDDIKFHHKYGWSVYHKNNLAYFGKSSFYGNLNINIGWNTYFSGHSTIRGNGVLDIGSFSSFGFNLYINIDNQNKPIKYPASIGLFNESRLVEKGDNIILSTSSLEKANSFLNIGSDVWMGQSVTLFRNITIGHGCVIGAYSLVTKDCEPFGIYVGRPARLIKYRFSESIIKELLELKWWDWAQEKIERNAQFFSTDLTKYSDSISNIVVD